MDDPAPSLIETSVDSSVVETSVDEDADEEVEEVEDALDQQVVGAAGATPEPAATPEPTAPAAAAATADHEGQQNIVWDDITLAADNTPELDDALPAASPIAQAPPQDVVRQASQDGVWDDVELPAPSVAAHPLEDAVWDDVALPAPPAAAAAAPAAPPLMPATAAASAPAPPRFRTIPGPMTKAKRLEVRARPRVRCDGVWNSG